MAFKQSDTMRVHDGNARRVAAQMDPWIKEEHL
jgi:hypothetical protein